MKSNVFLFFFLREKGAKSELHFVIRVCHKLLLVKPTTANFLLLFAVCGRTRSLLRLLVDRILNSLRLKLLALKAQFNFFLLLACSCGARTSCATTRACIIFGLYCILSLTSSIYDPLMFLAPIILSAKKLLQDLCKQRLDWDDLVGENESQRWEKWKADLPKLSQLAVKRCVKPPDLGKLKLAVLHHFADASQFAFGPVSYLRMVDLTECLLLVPHGEVPSCAHQAHDSPKTRTLSCSSGRTIR